MTIETPADLARAMQLDWVHSDEQWAAISAPLEPAVVIAGAGSGKTTVMAARVVYLVLTGQVRPDQVLGLTFTTKAAAELRQKILEALTTAGALDLLDPSTGSGTEVAEDVLEPTVATYNAYAASLLTDHGLRIGHEPDTRVISDAVRFQLGARVVDRHTEPIEFLTDHAETAIQDLLALESTMSEHLVSEQQVLEFDASERIGFERALAEEEAGKNRITYKKDIAAAINAIDRRRELLGLVAGYRRLKAEYGLMDFSDQIALGARLAAEQPEVGAAERERFKVVLLDEYQDTSVAQAIMLSRLFSGPDEARGRGHAVTAVGDPNQAIYGWRGASVSNILGFAETFPRLSGDDLRFHLSVSRRSERRILDVANRLAGPLYDRYGDQVAPLRAASGKGDGEVAVRVFETDRDELDWLAGAVQAAHAAKPESKWSHIGVLTRDNSHAEGVFDALTSAGTPVEIVGLSGLLRLAEVAHVVAVLKLLRDVTDNAAMLTLLAGPRWSIGPRDLKLLGKRAREIAGHDGRQESDARDLATQIVELADGIDPAEIPCLDDALADPGDADYSTAARERFALLRDELRILRSHVGEPLLDLVRRIIDTTGVDVELASSNSPAAEARRDNLDLFVRAVADFQAVDGEVSLASLLAYLTAEDEQGNGLDVATPTEADSVKLLTVHRAKGLEWDTVFCVGLCEGKFPNTRGRTRWVTSPSIMPTPLRGDAADLEHLHGHDRSAIVDYKQRAKDHDLEEELRLGYVALTRAARKLWVTSYIWGSTTTRPLGPSPYQVLVKEQLEAWGEPIRGWLDKPEKGVPHPLADHDPSVPWPVAREGAEATIRREAAELVRAADPTAPDDELDMVDASRVAEWDAEIDRLVAEALRDRADRVVVPLPSSLSATALGKLREDPEAFARDLARPMPRPPSSAARFGTRFHAWVEARFGQQELFEYDEIAGRGDAGIEDEAELKELTASFEAGPFGSRTPHAVEAPFALVLAGQVVRGRIDAVYTEGDGFLVVDWKTNRAASADPLQLALYRQAWAELAGVAPERVRAAFFYVRTGDLVVHEDLPDRAALEGLFGARTSLEA